MAKSLLGFWALVATSAFAQTEADQPAMVSAIQERAYRMQHELDLSLGVLPLDPFSKGLFARGTYAIHFTDAVAWEVVKGGYSYTAKTELRNQLERDFGILPTAFDQIQFFFGTDILLKPLYGKLSVANRWVVHGEFFVLLGASLFKFSTTAGDFRPGLDVGLGGRLFLNKTFSVRLDIEENFLVAIPSLNFTNVMAMSLSLGINIGATE
jgi:outer membrane beta-barrel protein